MVPEKSVPSPEQDLFRNRHDNMIDLRHELCLLAGLIDWSQFDAEFGSLYSPGRGCPGKSTRLMVGLQYLKHVHGLSDEEFVRGWVENPYWQHFCGETHFQYQAPIDPSSMTWFRKRIGERGCELLLAATMAPGLKAGAVKARDMKRVTVDTTVQEKAVAFPADSKLLNRSRVRLVKLCQSMGVGLRQSYVRVGPKSMLQAGRYAHAKQMSRCVRKLKTRPGGERH